eukprot:TRINITY_DN1136_c0_g1_i9.p1 TRINITY_DN1136_c0_g1~~TRINITY_DN1136_c0_g1_i9.p1  ORF type:complete len:432 (+),score=88.60 TRINITY_DN1136_c0_g1_i9:119-1414(+)
MLHVTKPLNKCCIFLLIFFQLNSILASPSKPVVPSHERTKNGVRFNVETVQMGSELRKYDTINAADIASAFYEKSVTPQIEVTSLTREQPHFAGTGLADVVLTAFDNHLPLVLRPDDVWLMLAYSFSKHVEKNSEALRKNFVQHEGKKNLLVIVNHFVMGGMQPEDWERDVFPKFSQQIKDNVGEQIHSVIAGGFSTTTPSLQAAHEITLMATMKHYFSYTMLTDCGIPWIELQGTEQDWMTLRERAKKMCSLMIAQEGEKWFSFLEPVLNEFVDTYQGKVNHHFWQGIAKRVQHGRGSGSYATVSGWITLLYHELNGHHKQWDQMISSDGPEPKQFPRVISSAPVSWEYNGPNFFLHFHAGIFGGNWDPETKAVSCHVGWVVSHDPPKTVEETKKVLSEELEDLKKSKSDDYNTQRRIDKIEQLLKYMED